MRVPAVDIADDTFLAVPPGIVAAEVADPRAWARWWPDLEPTVTRDRGVKGVQWSLRGALVGNMEVWLEPVHDGTVLHWYLRADRLPGAAGREGGRQTRRDVQDTQARVRAWKAHAFALKDRLEWAERVT